MLSGHPGISPWVTSPRGPKEGDYIRGWTVKTVTIAKSDKVYSSIYSIFGDLVETFPHQKASSSGMAKGAPPIPMERLQKWEYSESSSSMVVMAPSGQLLLVTISLEGKSLSAGYKHSAALSSCLNICTCWPTCSYMPTMFFNWQVTL